MGFGNASGTYTVSTTEIDLKGEMVELPVYLYVSKVGFTAGVKLMEFAIRGSLKNGDTTTNVSYTQSLLALTVGWFFQVTDRISIAPQIVRSYTGNSRFHYSTYFDDSYSGEYVTGTDTIQQNAVLSGYEIPVYYTGDVFLLGVKLCGYSSGADINTTSGTTGTIDVNGGLALVMEAYF